MQYNKNCPLVLYSYFISTTTFSRNQQESFNERLVWRCWMLGEMLLLGLYEIFLKFVFGDQFICIIYNNIGSSLDGLLIIETASQWGLHCLMFNLGGLYCEVQSTLFIVDTEGPQVRVHVTESRK